MAYRSIEPFPDPATVDEMASAELASWAKVWRERRGDLEESGQLEEFLHKLRREWAIETGIIERLYAWDRGVTETLIAHGIDAAVICEKSGLDRDRAEQAKRLIDDQLSIVEELFAFVKREQGELTEHYIRSLHQGFTRHQETTEAATPTGTTVQIPLLRGEYKKLPNNPRRPDDTTHEYCPPERVRDEMQRLLSEHQGILDAPPEVSAAWLHHRFTQIHPFQDGNGRVARALATLVFLRAGLFPLVIREQDRPIYFNALELADAGDLSFLVKLFAERQKRAVLDALKLEKDAREDRHAEAIIESALDVLKRRNERQTDEMREVFQVADRLLAFGSDRFDELKKGLARGLAGIEPVDPGVQYKIYADDSAHQPRRRDYFRSDTIMIARRFDYFANFEPYRGWIRLKIVTEESFHLVVHFHGYGAQFRGIMAVSAFTSRGSDETAWTSPEPTMSDLFQFNYAENPESIVKRFRDWLEAEVIVPALADWRRTLGG